MRPRRGELARRVAAPVVGNCEALFLAQAAPSDRVHESGGPCAAAALGELDALVDGRVSRDLIEKEYLIKRYAEKVPDIPVHVLRRLARDAREDRVDPAAPAERAVDDFGEQCAVGGGKRLSAQRAIEKDIGVRLA